MSFFRIWIKKMKDSYLLWVFSLFLIVSCLFISDYGSIASYEYYMQNIEANTVHSYAVREGHSLSSMLTDTGGEKNSNANLMFIENGIVSNMKAIDAENEIVADSNTTLIRQEADPTVMTSSDVSQLYAKYALLMDRDNGRVLFEKDGYSKAPMASTTKIMTLVVTLENANLEDMVTVSEYAASMPDVQLNIRSGEQYRLKDLLYSLMLESHNDSAVAIAEHVGGGVEGFAALMNEKAQELGAYQTHFVTPNGLDHEEHYTTAYDLALIASYAVKNPDFCEIIQTPSYSFHEQTTGRAFTVNNKDRFLTSYPGAIGIKTGFTGNAGYCFVGAVDRDDKHLVSVVLASGWPPHKMYKWQDTTKLMDYGLNNYTRQEVLTAETEYQPVKVEKSIEGGTITPYAKDSVSLLLSEGENVTYDIQLPKTLTAPVKQDATIGSVTIYIDGNEYQVLPLYAREGKRLLTFNYILQQLARRYFLCDELCFSWDY